MSRPLSLALIALLSGPGCGSGTPPEPPAALVALDHGWIPGLLSDPDAFSRLTAGAARQGWVAFHGGDHSAAAQELSGVAAGRAWLAEASLDEDLARLQELVLSQTFEAWAAGAGVPKGSAMPVLAAIVALEAGDPAGSAAWLARGAPYADPEVAKLATELAGGLAGVTGQGRIGAFVKAQLDARASGEPAPASREGAGAPLVVEKTATGELKLQRPLVFRTEAALALKRANAALGQPVLGAALLPAQGDAPLETLIFGPWWSTDDLRADLALDPSLGAPGAAGPGWLGLGPVVDRASPDSADIARARVAELDGRLNGWREARAATLPPPARELLDNLQLVEGYRAQLLLGWARAALMARRPLEAEVYARMGQDLGRLREIGPTNPPGLYVVLAEALVRTNRAREALDALQPLADRDPDRMLNLTEPLSDLAVLRSMGRLGDSKEN